MLRWTYCLWPLISRERSRNIARRRSIAWSATGLARHFVERGHGPFAPPECTQPAAIDEYAFGEAPDRAVAARRSIVCAEFLAVAVCAATRVPSPRGRRRDHRRSSACRADHPPFFFHDAAELGGPQFRAFPAVEADQIPSRRACHGVELARPRKSGNKARLSVAPDLLVPTVGHSRAPGFLGTPSRFGPGIGASQRGIVGTGGGGPK